MFSLIFSRFPYIAHKQANHSLHISVETTNESTRSNVQSQMPSSTQIESENNSNIGGARAMSCEEVIIKQEDALESAHNAIKMLQ